MAHVPKYQLAVIVKGSGRKEARRICTQQLEPVPPAAHLVGVGLHRHDVSERQLQTAAQRPQFIEALDFENRLIDDPEGKCYMGGVPRSTYMPYPFQILQNEHDVVIYYQFATAFRRIFVDGKEEAPLDSWMGWSNGYWDGNTFVVEVTGLNGLACQTGRSS